LIVSLFSPLKTASKFRWGILKGRPPSFWSYYLPLHRLFSLEIDSPIAHPGPQGVRLPGIFFFPVSLPRSARLPRISFLCCSRLSPRTSQPFFLTFPIGLELRASYFSAYFCIRATLGFPRISSCLGGKNVSQIHSPLFQLFHCARNSVAVGHSPLWFRPSVPPVVTACRPRRPASSDRRDARKRLVSEKPFGCPVFYVGAGGAGAETVNRP